MQTVFITGANRGLGLEFARQYATDGWSVIATCRNPEAASELSGLAGVEVHALDVADFDAVQALADTLKDRSIDVLINNAGTYGPKGYGLGEVDFAAWEQVLRTNVLGPLRVAQCFAPNVAKGERKVMAFLSSKMGSMTDNTSGGGYIYRSSKAALNAVIKSLSHDLGGDGIVSLALHPGWVRTDMGGPNGLIDAPQSVSGLRQVIGDAGPRDNGGFFSYDGSHIPW